MAEYHFPVPGSVDEGKIVVFVRRHWGSFLGQFLLSFFMFLIPLAILTVLYFTFPGFFKGDARNFIVIGLSIYYLISATVAFISWVSFYYDIYIISEDSIVDIAQQGFFGRQIQQLSMLRVQDVTSNIKGFLPTFFGYGDVLVETAGEQSQNFLLRSIPNPQEVASKIMELHNQQVETEGRHHQLLEAEGSLAPGFIRSGGHHAGEGHPVSEDTGNIEHPEGVPPVAQASEEKPTYQELLKKEQEENKEGEISHNDLDKGGEIDLK